MRQLGSVWQAVREERVVEALTGARALSQQFPENRDVLHALAHCQRRSGRLEDALVTLNVLERSHARFGRLYEERGLCLAAGGDMPPAVTAFNQAVELNPTLSGSWSALLHLHEASGETAMAAVARDMLATLSALPGEVVAASSLFAEGDVAASEAVIREFLLRFPAHVEAMRLLARIAVHRDVLDEAEYLLETVLLCAPDYAAARYDFATVLWKRQRHAEARAQVERLLRDDTGNRALQTLQANVLVGLGDHESALGIFHQLLPGAAQPADVHLSIGHALKTIGRSSEAIGAYQRAARARPNFGDAYWSLANLKTYTFSDAEVAHMIEHERSASVGAVDRYHLCFALGKAMEDRGLFAESFAFYERGNRLKCEEIHYDPTAMERLLRAQATVCTAEFFEARRHQGVRKAGPVFIVGLPRAGSTLIEQILASHSCVEGTMEFANITRLAHSLSRRRPGAPSAGYPHALADWSADEAAAAGEQYLQDTRAYRGGKAFFIDKMPNNFRHIGLIHLILPQAKIIDARRGAMDCCFSNYRQLFATGQPFTYDLQHIGRYYTGYVELMAHWDRVLPGKVLRVQHEDLVADLEGNVRRMLDFLELEFEPDCLNFHQTRRSIRTPSSEQVRRPISTEAIGRWRHFQPWLSPLSAALGELAG